MNGSSRRTRIYGSRIRPDWTLPHMWDRSKSRVRWTAHTTPARPEPGDCPWCGNPPDRPWGTRGTSNRNVRRALRNGRARRGRFRGTTVAVCNHPCHQTAEPGGRPEGRRSA